LKWEDSDDYLVVKSVTSWTFLSLHYLAMKIQITWTEGYRKPVFLSFYILQNLVCSGLHTSCNGKIVYLIMEKFLFMDSAEIFADWNLFGLYGSYGSLVVRINISITFRKKQKLSQGI
jgi:hypothetical protein